MPDAAATPTPAAQPRRWDTDTAALAIVVGSLAFLVLIRRGFRGLVVGVS